MPRVLDRTAVAEDRRTGEAYQQFAEPERENRRTETYTHHRIIRYKVVCKRVYEVERILLILTPQKWGVIIVQKGKKNILII